MRLPPACSVAFVLALLLRASSLAAAGPRPLFEPTDLELEDPGALQIDTQFGALQGEAGTKTAVPDFELDLGLTRNVEINIDGQYAIEGPNAQGFRWNKPGPDNLWVASKLGLWDKRDTERKRAWAFGLQLGPKIPFAREAKGIGYEGLLLLSRKQGAAQLVANLGALVDPGATVSKERPAGIEGGLDLSVSLTQNESIRLLGEVGGVGFLSSHPNQLHVSAGVSWGATKSTDLSLIGLKGLLSAGERYGVLLGVAQRFSLLE